MKRLIGFAVAIALSLGSGYCETYGEADPRDSESPFGVLAFLGWNHDWNFRHNSGWRLETTVALMREAGVGFVRMDFLWDDIEPAPGRFDFEKYDRIVDLLTRNDIKILGLLSYNASWAAEYWNSAPDPDFFTRYARAVVNRYRDRVRYWEIWNEPDDPRYWREQDSMRSYTDLLKKVYTALKEEDPSCVVLMGGVSQTISVSLKNIYRNGGRDYFDIVNVHPFVDPGQSDAKGFFRGVLKGLYKVMERYGDAHKEIWITEIGCPGVKLPMDKAGWWLGRAPTEEEQAQWLVDVYKEAFKIKNVKKVFWAFFRDTPNHFGNAVDYFGLVRKDFSKKPAFLLFREFIRRYEGFLTLPS